MKAFSQLFVGLLSAIGSAVLVLAAASLALVEGGALPTLAPVATQPAITGTSPATGPLVFTATAPAATMTPTPICPRPAGWIDYVIQQGDTLASLVQQSNISQAEFLQGNCFRSASIQLEPGWTIYLPPSAAPTATMAPTATAVTPLPTVPPTIYPTAPAVCPPVPRGWVPYVVRPGDTLYKLSLIYGIPWTQLMYYNCLPSQEILAGQMIYVPYLPPPPVPTSTPYPSATPVTPVPPTAAPTNTPVTPAPTNTPVTPAPTNTPVTPAPTDTPVTPAPTNTPVTPAPTDTPVTPAPGEIPTTEPTSTSSALVIPTPLFALI